MKIDGSNKPGTADQVRLRQNSQAAKGKGGDAGSRSVGEQVDVSSTARALQSARAPEVPDQAKIARLKEAIRNGEFKIDVDRIASRILEEEF